MNLGGRNYYHFLFTGEKLKSKEVKLPAQVTQLKQVTEPRTEPK